MAPQRKVLEWGGGGGKCVSIDFRKVVQFFFWGGGVLHKAPTWI